MTEAFFTTSAAHRRCPTRRCAAEPMLHGKADIRDKGNQQDLPRGKQIESNLIPNTWDRFALPVDWVENGKSVKLTERGKSLPMCSYPEYPKYNKGAANAVESYSCSAK
jgi:hypothetical protein